MAVYIINLALIFIWGFFLTHVNPTETKKKIYCTIVAIQWIFISGLRHSTVGSDTSGYKLGFHETANTSWKVVLTKFVDYLLGKEIEGKDPGYTLLEKIFQIFSQEYQLWLFFIAIVFTGLMARWVYKYSSMPDVSFLIYSVLFFAFFSVTGHRQTLATALVFFLGYEYAKKRKFLKFIIVAFMAYMLHKSSIVFVVYYIIANLNITPLYVGGMIAGSLLVAILGKQLYGPIALALGFDESGINNTLGGAETYAAVLTLLCIVSIVFIPWIRRQRKDLKYIYNLLFLTLATTLLVFQNMAFMRIQQYFSMVIMIIVPEIIQAFDRNYRVIAYLFISIFLVAYFINLNPQYKFFFMS